MARDFHIYSSTMVSANFGAHIPANTFTGIANGSRFVDLGLTVDPIQVSLNFKHQDVRTDAYGTEIPVDQQFILADATIRTKLVNWDDTYLKLCMQEACAGGWFGTAGGTSLANAGTLMGGVGPPAIAGVPFIPPSGYHYVSLNLFSVASGTLPYRFPAAYLSQRPIEFNIGSQRSVMDCTWRAIPFGVIAPTFNTTPVSGGRLSIRTAMSLPDYNAAVGSVLEDPIFLWDNTLDA